MARPPHGDRVRPIVVELSVLALYSQVGLIQVSGLLDTRIVPRFAAEAVAQDPTHSDDLVPLAIMREDDPPMDVVDVLADLTRSWHGPDFLTDPDEGRWLLTLYWMACIADQRTDPLVPIRLIRHLGVGEELREPAFLGKYPQAQRGHVDVDETARAWRAAEQIDYDHDHDGRPYSTAEAAAAVRGITRRLVSEDRAWITASGARYLRPINDPSWL